MTKSALDMAKRIYEGLERTRGALHFSDKEDLIALYAVEFEAYEKRIEELERLNQEDNADYYAQVTELKRKLELVSAHDKSRVNCLLKVDELERKLGVARKALTLYAGIPLMEGLAVHSWPAREALEELSENGQ